MSLVIEYHYDDGDVGAHPADIEGSAEEQLWDGFSKHPGHKPSHIVIRLDTTEGQELSDKLFKAVRNG